MTKSSNDSLLAVLNKGADKTYPCTKRGGCTGTMRRVSFTSESPHHVSIRFKWQCDVCKRIDRNR